MGDALCRSGRDRGKQAHHLAAVDQSLDNIARLAANRVVERENRKPARGVPSQRRSALVGRAGKVSAKRAADFRDETRSSMRSRCLDGAFNAAAWNVGRYAR